MKTEFIVLNEERNVTLTAYIMDVDGEYRFVKERPAVLVIPGGGYQYCSDREADPVALAYLRAGFDAIILRYSVKENAVWPRPLLDYEEAMEYILSRADEWHIIKDKIAVIGFSAGGHLAASAATMAEHRPAAAILGYPVISADTAAECEKTAPGVAQYVDDRTCPCFIFATRTDDVVPIKNSLEMMNALNEHDISFESHIYSYGPHGYSLGDASIQPSSTAMTKRAKNWVSDSIEWLKEALGDFTDDGLSKPAFKAKISADSEAWLSLDCSIGRIFGNPEAMRALDSLVDEMKKKIEPFEPDMSFEDMMELLKKMTLKNLLLERGIFTDRFDEMNEELGKIPNI